MDIASKIMKGCFLSAILAAGAFASEIKFTAAQRGTTNDYDLAVVVQGRELARVELLDGTQADAIILGIKDIIWNKERTMAAIAIRQDKKTRILVIEGAHETVNLIDLSSVEDFNVQKTGVTFSKNLLIGYTVSRPKKWIGRKDGLRQIEIQTTVYLKNGRSISASEAVIFTDQGDVLLR
jgi:hypothetical protein